MPPLDRYYPFLLGMGLILSPLNFAALGNAAGLTGSHFPIVLLSVLAVHLLTAHSYQAFFFDGPREERETSQAPSKIDPFLALLLGSRLSLAISALPLILVSAGFIFNELFLYWFPNFGFAYGMLILLLLLNLLGEKTVLRTQIIFVGSALVGMWLISTIGLWSAIFSPEAVKHASPEAGPAFPGIAAALLLFIGFDLAELDRSRRGRTFSGRPLRMATVLLLSGLSFLLWGIVSLLHVPAASLVETTVAHIVAARNILGEPGARIMGVVVLAGAGAAVNALFFSIPRLLAGLPDSENKSDSATQAKKPKAVFLILLAGVIALVMGLGLAGESELEVALKAALLLWLSQNACVHLLVLLRNRQDRTRTSFSRTAPLTGLVLLTGALVGILLTENQPLLLISLLLAFLLISWFLSLIFIIIHSRSRTGNRETLKWM
jgi:amino acid transporter